jgi:type I restriction enzyme S subunit
MFIERIGFNNLETRLDAGFYEPRYLKLSERLKTLGAVSLKTIVSKIACGPFGGNAIADDIYQDDGLLFIRPVNISSNVFDDSKVVKVPEVVLVENGLKVYDGENLYFGRVGVPCVALISGRTSISPNIIIAQTKGISADPYYLSCFSSSIYGLSQLKRQLKEVAQPTTSTDAVKDLLVYKPHIDVQTYIGNKVRQAELLKKWAKVIYADIQEKLEVSIGKYDETISRYERVNQNLLSNRLDQNHYQTHLLDSHKLLISNPHVLLGDTSQFVNLTDGDHGNPQYGDGPIYLRANEIKNGLIEKSNVVRLDKLYADKVSTSCWVKANDIVFSIVGTLGMTAVIDHETVGLMSRGMAKITSLELPNYYVKAFFKSKYFSNQLIRHSVGTIQRGVYLEAMKQLIVPILNTESMDFIAAKEKLADCATDLSENLILTSKSLVESLIEGRITESQLISVQQALEEGDNSKDRSILSKLTDKGYLTEGGKLLVDDLDKLYDLLDEAKVAMDLDGELA